MNIANRWAKARFTVALGDGMERAFTVQGRVRWALECLIAAGPKGCTTLGNPAPRLSAYVHDLRHEHGLEIETLTEEHGGPFAGHHAICFTVKGQACWRGADMNAQSLISSSKRESHDCYHREVIRSGRWRIIEGTCGVQWVLQYLARIGGPDTARWEGRHYCRTREALIRLWQQFSGEDGSNLEAMLPERFVHGGAA